MGSAGMVFAATRNPEHMEVGVEREYAQCAFPLRRATRNRPLAATPAENKI